MPPLITGWFSRCRMLECHWRCRFFSSHQLALHPFVDMWRIGNLPCWLLIHKCQQPQTERTDHHTQDWSLHVDDSEAHSQLIALTPEVYGGLSVVFQQFTSCGLERGSRHPQQLRCSCVHYKLDKLVASQPRVVYICDKSVEPSRARLIFHQSGDHPRCCLRGSG